MARQPRYILPHYPQHVVQRGNNKTNIFYQPNDYLFFLELLSQAAETYVCDIHAYVLMTNHVHLLVTPHTEYSLSKLQQMLGRHYVPYFNKKYMRTGALWEGRFRSTIIESQAYFLACMRYIEMNPVRANMVTLPEQYRWSSYKHNALGETNTLLTEHEEYINLSEDAVSRQLQYQNLFLLPETDLQKIREMTHKGWTLGSKKFAQEIETQTKRYAEIRKRGRKSFIEEIRV